MNFEERLVLEERVEKAVALRRRRTSRNATTFFIVVAVCAGLAVYSLVLSFAEHDKDITILIPAFLCAFFILVFSYSSISLLWKKRWSLGEELEARAASEVDQGLVDLFEKALVESSVQAGITTPRMTVLDLDKVASLVYEDGKGEPTIVVSRGAVEAGLSPEEASAAMSRELAMLATGGQLRRWMIEKTAWVCAMPATGLALAAAFTAAFVKSWPSILGMLFIALGLRVFLLPGIEKRLTDNRLKNIFIADALGSLTVEDLSALTRAMQLFAAAGLAGVVVSKYSTDSEDITRDFATRGGPPMEERIGIVEAIARGDWKPFEQEVGAGVG